MNLIKRRNGARVCMSQMERERERGGSIIRVIGFHAETQRPMKNEGE